MPSSERWLSTHEAAAVMGCHPQTVRDRCARGELTFCIDSATGHRRIAGSELEAHGYSLNARSGRPGPRGRADFHASLQAEVEGVLTESAAALIADRLQTTLAERDETLVRVSRRLAETEAALRLLAAARFWQRSRLLAQLRDNGLLRAR